MRTCSARRTVTLLLLAALLPAGLLLASGCVRTTPRTDSGTQVTPGVSLRSLVDANLALPPGADHPPVLDDLAPPRHEELTPVPNRHVPGQIDVLRTLTYDGLQLTLYEVAGTGRVFLIRMRITSPAYEALEGLRVGSSRAEAVSALGRPVAAEDGSIVYVLTEIGDRLVVACEDGRVASMEWQFYWD